MDTGTHIAMGVAISGLALADYTVANDPSTMGAVFAGIMVGSLIPDIDTVLKLRNNAVYLRNHRGITHSVPAVMLWPLLISILLTFIVPGAVFLHVWAWTFLAVFIHVFVDIFNSYGTQALRPFSQKWVAIGVINTFDPIIFGLHVIAILAWILGTDPVVTMATLYIVIFFYYLLRFALKGAVKRAVKKTVPGAADIFIAPTMNFFQWRIAATTDVDHYVGRAYGRSITIYDRFKREPMPVSKEVSVALEDPNMQAFVSFSPLYRWSVTHKGDVCEVRLIDLRYRSKGYYPFVAVAHVDENLEVVNSYTGWIFSEDKLRKKLNFAPNN
ncbi:MULTISPECIES: metal-dependent hydrolase [Sporosarcina]|uniref:metal-dependent hydrolase n=1 Tax=Sporosarcina TaxID=1569 RepID=UPI00129AD162|nr:MULTISPECIES: metal-dependent hydrolase [Sporosarcina]GKV65083.1 membrane protein [Sporosarcina sp. NCCP-2331]GLB56876.1 membrane protein [Sporosarcina sp. NCCP-2378]